MSTLQAFRATLAALPAASAAADGATHRATCACALLDTSRHLNFLAGVPASVWEALLACAAATLSHMSGPLALTGACVPAILPDADLAAAPFDAMMTVHLPHGGAQWLQADMPHDSSVALHAERLLRKALGTRAERVCVFPPAVESCMVLGGPAKPWLCVGLVLHRKEVCSFFCFLFLLASVVSLQISACRSGSDRALRFRSQGARTFGVHDPHLLWLLACAL